MVQVSDPVFENATPAEGPSARIAMWASRGVTTRFVVVAVATYALLLLVSYPQLADPLVRHDDFPALFGDEHLFYEKTLAEGRWLNYWWIARPFSWAPWVNFAVYQLAWALFSAACAISTFGLKSRLFPTTALAAIIVLSPQAFLISSWFNTLLLGAWVVASFAVLSLYLSNRAARWAFLVFAPISMMAYSTYPLLMIALLMVRHDMRRSFLDLVGLILLLALGIGLGMGLMYSINYVEHGVFGIQIADWRNPTPATDLASLAANAEQLMPLFMSRLFLSSAYGVLALGVLNVGLLAVSLVMIAVRDKWLSAYLAAGISVSIGLIAVHGLKEGVEVPMRALLSVWVLYAASVVVAMAGVQTDRLRDMIRVGMIVLIGLYGGQILKNTGMFMTWQKETRALAAAIPPGAEAVYVFGQLSDIPGFREAYINHPLAFTERMRLFSGVPTFACDEPKGATCNGVPPFDTDAPTDRIEIKRDGTQVLVRIPAGLAYQADNR